MNNPGKITLSETGAVFLLVFPTTHAILLHFSFLLKFALIKGPLKNPNLGQGKPFFSKLGGTGVPNFEGLGFANQQRRMAPPSP